MRKRKGLVLSAQMVLALCLVVAVLGISAGAGFYMVRQWQTRTANIQAQMIDERLLQYSESHKSAYGKTITGGTNLYNLRYTRTHDYPFSINEIGDIGERDGKGNFNEDAFGYFNSAFHFTDKPEQNLFQFHYIPRDKDGKEVTPSSKAPITFYTVEYYTEDGFGEVKRNVSPRSYENLTDDQKKI